MRLFHLRTVHHRYLNRESASGSGARNRLYRQHTNHVRTVIFVIRSAELALQAGADLSANTNTVSNLDGCDLVANFDCLANDFMTDADWEGTVAPTAIDGMDIRAANAAAFNLNVDITVFKLFRFELEGF